MTLDTSASTGLFREAKLRPGEAVFINGGAGNVASAVLQLAAKLGARVLVSAGSEEALAYCQSLGAEAAVNYKTGDVVRAILDFIILPLS